MSVVSSPSSSSASTFPPPPTTTSANNDGKASEEKVEEDVVSELEQRVKDVEDTILRFGEKSDATKSVTKSASSSKQSASSTLLFAKLASLRSALVDSRTRFIAAKTSGKENEIKRLHDRLEKVLFQIAVVGVLKREDEKNGYQSVPFGRSARAIARDCLVLTFSFGNR
jgi:predicted transcriptional regulator